MDKALVLVIACSGRSVDGSPDPLKKKKKKKKGRALGQVMQ